MRVEVTRHEIENGVAESMWRSPVAKAITTAIRGLFPEIYPVKVYFHQGGSSINKLGSYWFAEVRRGDRTVCLSLPAEVGEHINTFDLTGKLEPCTFEILDEELEALKEGPT